MYYSLGSKVHSRKDSVGTTFVSALKTMRYLSVCVWEYCAKLQAVTGDLTAEDHSHNCNFGQGTDVHNWAGSRASPGLFAALQHSLSQNRGWEVLLSASCQTSFLGWVCTWQGEMGKKKKIKKGKQIQGRKECGGPEQKLKLGHVFTRVACNEVSWLLL